MKAAERAARRALRQLLAADGDRETAAVYAQILADALDRHLDATIRRPLR